MKSFEFHRPQSLADAVALLQGNDGAKLLAGGQSLLPVMKLDLAQPSDLVSLAGPQADLAWWMIMEPEESRRLAGIGSHDELLDLWEDATGQRATDLRWYLAFGAYRLAAIFARLSRIRGCWGGSGSDTPGASCGSSACGWTGVCKGVSTPPTSCRRRSSTSRPGCRSTSRSRICRPSSGSAS